MENNKKVFEDLENRGRTFEDESNEFAGDDVTVIKNNYLQLSQLTFVIKGGNDEINGKSFQENFKGGQDFEFVKYRVGAILEVDPELIKLNINDKPIIPIYSISDIEIGEKDVIVIEITN